jgi:hypothetical protein
MSLSRDQICVGFVVEACTLVLLLSTVALLLGTFVLLFGHRCTAIEGECCAQKSVLKSFGSLLVLLAASFILNVLFRNTLSLSIARQCRHGAKHTLIQLLNSSAV